MADSPTRKPPRAPGAYLRLPLWQRFALSFFVAAALLTAMVIFVQGHNTNTNPSTNPAAQLQANRDAEILVEQDQAPRSLRLGAGARPSAALEHAVRARIASQIAAGALAGPLQAAHCRAGGARTSARLALTCAVTAGSVSYEFLGVLDPAARTITYCKRDPPPAPSDNVPVSPRCRV